MRARSKDYGYKIVYSMNKFSKFLKHGKRLVAIMLVLFMNINSFATTTSNDGSAFITKAEFDSLINNFNNQIDTYQSGLNSKIDTSIANYIGGLSQEQLTPQTMLINNCNYRFKNDWMVFPSGVESGLGDKFQFAIMLGALAWGSTSYRVSRSIEWSNHYNGGAISTKGSTPSRYILVKDSSYNSSKFTITGRMESVPVSTWMGSYTHGAITTNPNSSPGSLSPYVGQIANGTTEYGMRSLSLSGTIFGLPMTMPTSYTYNSNDVITSNTDATNYVSSGSVKTGSTLYCVKTTELTKLNTSNRASMRQSCNDGWYKACVNSTTNYSQKSSHYTSYIVYGYDHYYYTVSDTNGYTAFIIDDVSAIASEDTKYYSGLPLFTATENGTVRVIFSVNGNTNSANLFEIRPRQFDNADITGGMSQLSGGTCSYVDDQGNVIKNIYNVPDGKQITAEFNCNKGTTYWIKVKPDANNPVKVTATSINIVKG